MKELSIEEKAKAYDEAKARMSRAFNSNRCTIGFMNEIFPELKEINDERIRKEIIDFVKSRGGFKGDWIAWLEKQGEPTDIPADAVLDSNKDGLIADTIQSKPKFKVGDWVIGRVTVNEPRQIAEITEEGYKTTYGGWIGFSFEEDMRLWTIQDAKDGDVLHSIGFHNDCIFIFNGLDNWRFDEPNGDRAVATGYCCLSVSADNMEFGIQGPDCIEVDTVKPATKIQRDLLFQKMKEAGYKWDAEKKELKNIEQEPAWSEADETITSALSQLLKDCELENNWNCVYSNDREVFFVDIGNWLKSIKDRVQPQPQWKPSEEQMNVLEYYMHTLACNEHKEILFGLYQDLKKLKE